MEYKNETLNEREQTHGDFRDTAFVSQSLKLILDGHITDKSQADLSFVQREALDNICQKLARIVSGNANDPDHWRDIAGYANLVEERLCA